MIHGFEVPYIAFIWLHHDIINNVCNRPAGTLIVNCVQLFSRFILSNFQVSRNPHHRLLLRWSSLCRFLLAGHRHLPNILLLPNSSNVFHLLIRTAILSRAIVIVYIMHTWQLHVESEHYGLFLTTTFIEFKQYNSVTKQAKSFKIPLYLQWLYQLLGLIIVEELIKLSQLQTE